MSGTGSDIGCIIQFECYFQAPGGTIVAIFVVKTFMTPSFYKSLTNFFDAPPCRKLLRPPPTYFPAPNDTIYEHSRTVVYLMGIILFLYHIPFTLRGNGLFVIVSIWLFILKLKYVF